MIHKNGNMFRQQGRLPRFDYAELVSIALRSELGCMSHGSKIVANWTGATERAASNWISGISGPNGFYLVRLLRKSDALLETVLSLAERPEALAGHFQTYKGWQNNSRARHPKMEDPEKGECRVPNDGPVDPNGDPDRSELLNTRQVWFLSQLQSVSPPSSREIVGFFGVSLKTAKRDIAQLKRLGLVTYQGTRRCGHYLAVTA